MQMIVFIEDRQKMHGAAEKICLNVDFDERQNTRSFCPCLPDIVPHLNDD